jgi:hypothetical protein
MHDPIQAPATHAGRPPRYGAGTITALLTVANAHQIHANGIFMAFSSITLAKILYSNDMFG